MVAGHHLTLMTESERDEIFTGSGFLRGTTSPANILIFSARSGPNKHDTIAET
jgi:hypothetical protein